MADASPEKRDSDLALQLRILRKPPVRRTKDDLRKLASTLASVPLFSSLDADVLQQVCKVLRLEHVPTGHTVFREGETGDKFYLVISGFVGVFVQNVSNTDVENKEDELAAKLKRSRRALMVRKSMAANLTENLAQVLSSSCAEDGAQSDPSSASSRAASPAAERTPGVRCSEPRRSSVRPGNTERRRSSAASRRSVAHGSTERRKSSAASAVRTGDGRQTNLRASLARARTSSFRGSQLRKSVSASHDHEREEVPADCASQGRIETMPAPSDRGAAADAGPQFSKCKDQVGKSGLVKENSAVTREATRHRMERLRMSLAKPDSHDDWLRAPQPQDPAEPPEERSITKKSVKNFRMVVEDDGFASSSDASSVAVVTSSSNDSERSGRCGHSKVRQSQPDDDSDESEKRKKITALARGHRESQAVDIKEVMGGLGVGVGEDECEEDEEEEDEDDEEEEELQQAFRGPKSSIVRDRRDSTAVNLVRRNSVAAGKFAGTGRRDSVAASKQRRDSRAATFDHTGSNQSVWATRRSSMRAVTEFTRRQTIQRAKMDKQMAQVAELGRGSCFGEVALQTDAPRTATVKTKQESYLATLTRDDYKAIMQVFMDQQLNDRKDFLASIPLFDGVPEGGIAKLAAMLQQKDLKKGTPVYHCDSAVLQVFIVRAGEFSVDSQITTTESDAEDYGRDRVAPGSGATVQQSRGAEEQYLHRQNAHTLLTVAMAKPGSVCGLSAYLLGRQKHSESVVCRSASGSVFQVFAKELVHHLPRELRAKLRMAAHAQEMFYNLRRAVLQRIKRPLSASELVAGKLERLGDHVRAAQRVYTMEGRMRVMREAAEDVQAVSRTRPTSSTARTEHGDSDVRAELTQLPWSLGITQAATVESSGPAAFFANIQSFVGPPSVKIQMLSHSRLPLQPLPRSLCLLPRPVESVGRKLPPRSNRQFRRALEAGALHLASQPCAVSRLPAAVRSRPGTAVTGPISTAAAAKEAQVDKSRPRSAPNVCAQVAPEGEAKRPHTADRRFVQRPSMRRALTSAAKLQTFSEAPILGAGEQDASPVSTLQEGRASTAGGATGPHPKAAPPRLRRAQTFESGRAGMSAPDHPSLHTHRSSSQETLTEGESGDVGRLAKDTNKSTRPDLRRATTSAMKQGGCLAAEAASVTDTSDHQIPYRRRRSVSERNGGLITPNWGAALRREVSGANVSDEPEAEPEASSDPEEHEASQVEASLEQGARRVEPIFDTPLKQSQLHDTELRARETVHFKDCVEGGATAGAPGSDPVAEASPLKPQSPTSARLAQMLRLTPLTPRPATCGDLARSAREGQSRRVGAFVGPHWTPRRRVLKQPEFLALETLSFPVTPVQAFGGMQHESISVRLQSPEPDAVAPYSFCKHTEDHSANDSVHGFFSCDLRAAFSSAALPGKGVKSGMVLASSKSSLHKQSTSTMTTLSLHPTASLESLRSLAMCNSFSTLQSWNSSDAASRSLAAAKRPGCAVDTHSSPSGARLVTDSTSNPSVRLGAVYESRY